MALCSGLRRGHSGSALQITGRTFDSKTKNHLQMLLSVFRVGAALADDFIFYKIPLCRKPLPLGEVSSLAMTERARKLTGKHTHSDNIAITKAKNHAVHSSSFEPGLPSQALRASSPKGRAYQLTPTISPPPAPAHFRRCSGLCPR